MGYQCNCYCFSEEPRLNAIIPNKKVASLGQVVFFKCASHVPVVWFHKNKLLRDINTLRRENTLIILGVR